MLAYVFWHWKQAKIAAQADENRQRAFHVALAAAAGVAGTGSPWHGAEALKRSAHAAHVCHAGA